MEVKQDEMTEEKWAEMSQIVRDNICAECQADLTIYTIPDMASLRAGCVRDKSHRGFVRRETWTEAYRRGALAPQPIQTAIEKKMLPRSELGRAMNLLALRYPDAIRDPSTAALFIIDCARLDIDPLISPAEAVPVPFKSKRKDEKGNVIEEKTTITMVITEDGWLSMAARGCKDDWVGPPKTMRLEDYLMTLPEHKERSYEDIQKIAREIKESKCKDPEAWYYVAIGKRRGGEDTVVPGYFTHKDHGKAEKGFLPAATQPGNQARVRAIKRWVREVFPECRQKMIELTAEWYQRAEGIRAAREYIDAEYSIINLTEEEGGTRGEVAKEKLGVATPKSKTQATKQETPPAVEETSPEETIEGEGFHIDLTWLNQALKAINWSEDTTKSWLSKFKIDTKGSLKEVLSRCSREQAEEFIKEVQNRAAQQTMDFWS